MFMKVPSFQWETLNTKPFYLQLRTKANYIVFLFSSSDEFALSIFTYMGSIVKNTFGKYKNLNYTSIDCASVLITM